MAVESENGKRALGSPTCGLRTHKERESAFVPTLFGSRGLLFLVMEAFVKPTGHPEILKLPKSISHKPELLWKPVHSDANTVITMWVPRPSVAILVIVTVLELTYCQLLESPLLPGYNFYTASVNLSVCLET
ncbi:hypothetical protein GN956_G6742 [Arapaima gigas]